MATLGGSAHSLLDRGGSLTPSALSLKWPGLSPGPSKLSAPMSTVFRGLLSPVFYNLLSEEQICIDFRTTQAVNYRS